MRGRESKGLIWGVFQFEDAREYAKGRSIRFDVRVAEDVAIVKQIASIKMAN